MNHELFESLDRKINELLVKYAALKDENLRLIEENHRFQTEREGIRQRVDVILGKLDGV
jgi:cell division protein ZapB